MTTATKSSAQGELLSVRLVRAAMNRAGLPRYRQSAWLAEKTGISYSQAHRRLNGTASWTLEELVEVAGLLGETLGELVSVGPAPSAVRGKLVVDGPTELDCDLWLGEATARRSPSVLVAVETASGWVVSVGTNAPKGTAFTLQRLEVRTATSPHSRVAVLDDDQDLTDSICDNLTAKGFDAEPFYEASRLLSRLQDATFDAYVIDWVLGDSTALPLMASLRAINATSPILILTGQVMAGVVSELDIADAIKRYDLLFSEKPLRTSILSAALARALASSRLRAE